LLEIAASEQKRRVCRSTTAKGRFFGIVHYAGVKRVTLANSSGGIEIDHLQYGR
jgi:hypothetical protein